MGDWITVIALIIAGISLLVVEIIFVPGTTVVGILGVIAMVVGFYLGFEYFGNVTGGWILAISLVGSITVLVYTFRSRSWERFGLEDTSEGKFNEDLVADLNVDDEGITVSTLRPIGKAEIKDKEYEVKTLGNYLNSGTRIRIIRIESNNIIVEPIKE